MKELEDILLLALRPLIKMANVWHERSRTAGENLAASQSLIDALVIAGIWKGWLNTLPSVMNAIAKLAMNENLGSLILGPSIYHITDVL